MSYETVHLNPKGSELSGSSRRGTLYATLEDIEEYFGNAHDQGDGNKVSFRYFFETPAGRATIRDYHWNRRDEQSICAQTQEAADHLIDYLNALGLKADSRFGTCNGRVDRENEQNSRWTDQSIDRPADPEKGLNWD